MYNPGSCRLLSPTSAPIAVAIGSKFACPYVTFGMQLSRIVRSLAAVINILDPDAIVLGGGLSCLNIRFVNRLGLRTRCTYRGWQPPLMGLWRAPKPYSKPHSCCPGHSPKTQR